MIKLFCVFLSVFIFASQAFAYKIYSYDILAHYLGGGKTSYMYKDLVLNEIQDIDYYSLYESEKKVNGNKETYTFKADLDEIIDTLRDIIDAFEKGLSFIPEDDENKATMTTLLDMLNDDLKNRVPTLFDVSMNVHFEEVIVISANKNYNIDLLMKKIEDQ